MTTALPTPPIRYFAEHWAGVQVTRRAEGARREDWVTVTAPKESSDPVARLTAPYDPKEHFANDRLLHANGWRRVSPWEYIAGRNASRAEVEPLRPYVTAVQAAVRAAEERPARDTLAALDAALCDMPVNAMDDAAEISLHDAIRAVSLAEAADEWAQLDTVRCEVAEVVAERGGVTMGHPAVRAVVQLAAQCGSRSEIQDVDRSRWGQGYFDGLNLLRRLGEVILSSEDPRVVYTAGMAFISSVERAIVCRALCKVREALADAARAYGLFVIGMRQPASEESWADFTRRIGSATYMFEITPPFVAGCPYGAVRVRRIAEDGTHEEYRFYPLGPDKERRAAVRTAVNRL